MKVNKNSKTSATGDWFVVLLFFAGVALIAAGLWQIWKPMSLVFLGITCWYVAGCVSIAVKSPERTDRK